MSMSINGEFDIHCHLESCASRTDGRSSYVEPTVSAVSTGYVFHHCWYVYYYISLWMFKV